MSDLHECFQDPDVFSKKPNRPLLGRFVAFVASQPKEEAIAFWLSYLEGLSRYDPLFKPSRSREFTTSLGEPITRTATYKKLKNTTITLSTVAHVAWALTLANRAAFDDVFYLSVRSGRQMALPEVDEIIGQLYGIVPTRMRLKTEDSLERLLRSTQEFMLSATPYEPFAAPALEEHFGHKRYRQSIFVYQTPQDPVSATTTVREKSGAQSRLRVATELNSHIRFLCGLMLKVTPKDDELGIWARYDEHFLERAQVHSVIEEFVQMTNRLLTSKSNLNLINSSSVVIFGDSTMEEH